MKTFLPKLILALLFLSATGVSHASDSPRIEISSISGVAGYQIGIFGAGFGEQAGAVEILGGAANVDEWSDDFVRVTVPQVVDGSDAAGLVLTTANGGVTSAEFTVYTINPDFLLNPYTSFTNVSAGKPLQLDGIDMTYSECSHFETGETVDAFSFLTNYVCRHDVGAKFSADSDRRKTATITIDLVEPVEAGSYLFQFFARSDWAAASRGQCPGTGYPYAYTIESSRNGRSWSDPLASVSDNLRGNRSHFVALENDTQFVRLRVTDALADCRDDIEGRDFELKEVNLYRVEGDASLASRALAIYGDSITANAFNAYLGAQGLASRIEKEAGSNLPLVPMGLSGRKASQLSEDFEDVNELSDAFAEAELAGSARYWGIALGTNDMNLSGPEDSGFTDPTSQFNAFDEAIEEDAVRWLIEHGRVPILARMHDTDSAENGYGFLEAKIQILNATDRIAAKYRLIPGPDMYTEFRLNIDRDDATWIAGDGTHLANDGPDVWVQLWSNAISRAFDQSVEPPPLPTPVPPIADVQAPESDRQPRIALLAIGLGLLLIGFVIARKAR